ncbi:hypothetical protein SCA6_003641 [Theobroma cacao]
MLFKLLGTALSQPHIDESPAHMSPSALALLLILLGTLCSFIYVSRPKRLKNGRKLPPGPRPLPVIGNLHLLGKLPHLNLHHLAKRYGPIMPKVQASEYLSFGGKGMGFTEYGSYWRTVRKWCTLHLLSSSKVEYFAPVRKAELGSMVETVKKAAAAGETLDISGKVGELIEDIMYKMIFGRPSNSKDDNFNLKLLIKEISRLAGAFNMSDYIPYLAPLDLQVTSIHFSIIVYNYFLNVSFIRIDT